MAGQPEDIDLRAAALMFLRYRRFLAACIVLGTGIGALLGMQRTPLYTADATIAIDPHENRVLNARAVVADMRTDYATVQTQLSIITSRQLAEQVIDKLGLDRRPEFVAPDAPGLLARTRQQVTELVLSQMREYALIAPGTAEEAGAERAVAAEAGPTDAAPRGKGMGRVMAAFLNSLTATNVSDSNVISVAFTSRDRKLAAEVANTVAQLYVADQRRNKVEATTEASRWLEGRVGALRTELLAAEHAAEQFRTANGLVETGGETLSAEHLADLNRQVLAADAELAVKEAALKVVRDRSGSGDSLDAVAQVAASPLLAHLREQEADLVRREAQLLSTYGPRHPQVLDATAEHRNLDAKIEAEVQRIVRQLETDATMVRNRQRALRASLDEVTQRSNSDRQAEIRLRELEREAQVIREQYQAFLERFKETRDQTEIAAPDAVIISPALTPLKPSSAGLGLFLLAGFSTGAFIGVLGTVVRERFDTGLRSMDQVESRLGLGCLGLVPAVRPPRRQQTLAGYLLAQPSSAYAESLRQVRTALRMSHVDRAPKVVLVTSSLPHEGKTTFATSYAVAAALDGARVLLIDLDLRQPAVTRRLALAEPTAGVVEVLTGDAGVADTLVHLDEADVDVLPVATRPALPSKLLESNRLRQLVEEQRQRYDLVVIDSPPLMLVSDAQLIAPLADTVVLIVQWHTTARATVERVLNLLRQGNAPIAGVVLTRVDLRRHAEYGYGDVGSYYSRYRNYYQPGGS